MWHLRSMAMRACVLGLRFARQGEARPGARGQGGSSVCHLDKALPHNMAAVTLRRAWARDPSAGPACLTLPAAQQRAAPRVGPGIRVGPGMLPRESCLLLLLMACMWRPREQLAGGPSAGWPVVSSAGGSAGGPVCQQQHLLRHPTPHTHTWWAAS
ncbi:hypothetical protein V8C86DRAFT_3018353 [Haematococcus lacustris]